MAKVTYIVGHDNIKNVFTVERVSSDNEDCKVFASVDDCLEHALENARKTHTLLDQCADSVTLVIDVNMLMHTGHETDILCSEVNS